MTREKKWTPGPWKKSGLHWVGSNGETVIVSDGPAFGSRSQFPQAEANAHLISQAPAMLAELEYLCRDCYRSATCASHTLSDKYIDSAIGSLSRCKNCSTAKIISAAYGEKP